MRLTKGLTLQKIMVQLQSQQKMLQVPIRVLAWYAQPIISVTDGVTIKGMGISNAELAGSIANTTIQKWLLQMEAMAGYKSW